MELGVRTGGASRRPIALVGALLAVALAVAGLAISAAPATGQGGGDPVGSLDDVRATPGSVFVRGWVADPDVGTNPSVVHIWRLGDAGPMAGVVADIPRPDVAAAFPGLGATHGFELTIPASLADGVHTFCAFGINVGAGTNAEVGCQRATVRSDPSPFGAIDIVDAAEDGSSVRVGGWAADIETMAPITVHIWRVGDPAPLAGVVADGARPDLQLPYPNIGVGHGYDVTLPVDLPDGLHTFCAFGINVGAGTNTSLGCRQDRVGPPPPNMVYLTFDDGPVPGSTSQILDILAAYGVPATFFSTGQLVSSHVGLAQRIIREGHSLENHTWSHPWLTGLSNAGISSELSRTNAAIEGIGAPRPNCMRPPGGFVDGRVRSVAAGLGLQTVMWTVDPQDWRQPGASAIASRVISATHPGAVILLHDGGGPRGQTVAALPTIISTLQAQGYEFGLIC